MKKRILNRSLAKELSPEELAKSQGCGTISMDPGGTPGDYDTVEH
jgi:hypothetical protein